MPCRSRAPRWRPYACSTTPPPMATLTLSPTLCNPSRTAPATYNAVVVGVKKPIQNRGATSCRPGPFELLRRGQPTMADTLVYVGRRFIQLFLVILVAGTVNFMIPRLIPGDPVDTALASARRLAAAPSSFDASRSQGGLEREVRPRPAALEAVPQLLERPRQGRPRACRSSNFPQPVITRSRRPSRGRSGCSACRRSSPSSRYVRGRPRRVAAIAARRRLLAPPFLLCPRSPTTCWRSS